jgi:hypothetical protein
MNKIVFVIIITLTVININVFSQKNKEKYKFNADTVSVDSIEYELIIFDPGFDAWLQTQPPKSFYAKEYYELKNHFYVQEWNHRYMSMANGSLIDTYIDYKPNTDYGLDLNYRLYNYFRYFEKTNRIKLIPSSR